MRTEDSWVKHFHLVGRYHAMVSKAPFYFTRYLPTLRWGSLSWRRYEFKVLKWQ